MLMAELTTAVQYDLPVKIVVLKNNGFVGSAIWNSRILGNPPYGCELGPIDFVKPRKRLRSRGLSLCDIWRKFAPPSAAALRSFEGGGR